MANKHKTYKIGQLQNRYLRWFSLIFSNSLLLFGPVNQELRDWLKNLVHFLRPWDHLQKRKDWENLLVMVKWNYVSLVDMDLESLQIKILKSFAALQNKKFWKYKFKIFLWKVYKLVTTSFKISNLKGFSKILKVVLNYLDLLESGASLWILVEKKLCQFQTSCSFPAASRPINIL